MHNPMCHIKGGENNRVLATMGEPSHSLSHSLDCSLQVEGWDKREFWALLLSLDRMMVADPEACACFGIILNTCAMQAPRGLTN